MQRPGFLGDLSDTWFGLHTPSGFGYTPSGFGAPFDYQGWPAAAQQLRRQITQWQNKKRNFPGLRRHLDRRIKSAENELKKGIKRAEKERQKQQRQHSRTGRRRRRGSARRGRAWNKKHG
jgi:hypothetical protein